MTIEASDLGGDPDLARRVISRARRYVPCIDTLEADAKAEAVSILKAVRDEIPAPGSRRVRSKSRNGTSITYDAPGSWFGPGDLDDLRALCGQMSTPAGPVGSFPATSSTVSRLWPEEQPR